MRRFRIIEPPKQHKLRQFNYSFLNEMTTKLFHLIHRKRQQCWRRCVHLLSTEVNIVLTHPKTGGNTLEALVSRWRPYSKVLFGHRVRPASEEAVSVRLASILPSLQVTEASERTKLTQNVRFTMMRAAAIAREIDRVPPPAKICRKINILSAVREPIGCYVSGYFQIMGDVGFRDVPAEKIADDIIKMIRRSAPVNQLHWWREQISVGIGVDILDQKFPKQIGWHVCETERFRLLTIRQESFSSLPTAMEAFLGRPQWRVTKTHYNAAADKAHVARDYARKKREIKFPADVLDIVYNNKWFNAFYSPEEERGFRKQWGCQ